MSTILVVSAIIILPNLHHNPYDQTGDSYKFGQTPEIDQALKKAQALFVEQKKAGIDFSKGPCLTNDLEPNWVADLVHNPRQLVDDLPGNECPAYIEGRARHFIELDINGKLVRIH